MPRSIPEWQLPPGVSSGLWDYVHDRGLARDYDASLSDSALAQSDAQFVAEQCSTPGRMLDLGCGTGRAIVHLEEKGHWTVGVDLSTEMLAIAKEKLDAPKLIRANLVDLSAFRDQTFDYACCLFSTFGMISGDDNRRRMLAQVHRILRPGGVFVVHVHNRWHNLRHAMGRRWLVADAMRQLKRSPARGDYVMPVFNGHASVTLHLFSRREICRFLVDAGFEVKLVEPVGLSNDGQLSLRWLTSSLRAYGFMIAARRR